MSLTLLSNQPTSKQCTKCKVEKLLSEFSKRTKSKDGLMAKCKVCDRNSVAEWQKKNPDRRLKALRSSYYKRFYGITLQQYEEMFVGQKGLCAICAQPEPHKYLAVDHDHQTGKVRALLCENCNRGLGMFKENTTSLFLAINYLSKFKK